GAAAYAADPGPGQQGPAARVRWPHGLRSRNGTFPTAAAHTPDPGPRDSGAWSRGLCGPRIRSRSGTPPGLAEARSAARFPRGGGEPCGALLTPAPVLTPGPTPPRDRGGRALE